MILKQTLVALFGLLMSATYGLSMEQQDVSTTFSKKLKITLKPDSIEPKQLPLELKINMPATITTDAEKTTYYASRKEAVFAQLKKVLEAYERAQVPQVGNPFVTIEATALLFNADTNTFVIKQEWGTHQITNTITAHLETCMACTYLPQEQKLTHNEPTLYVTDAKTHKVQMVTMEALHRQYPHQNQLNMNPATAQRLSAQVMQLSLERTMGLLAGKNTAELPDPEAFTRDLYIPDLKKLVAFHLAQQAK